MGASRYYLAAALLAAATAPVDARDDRPPQQVTIGRSEPVHLWAQAQRTHLQGTVGLYSVAVYAEGNVDIGRLPLVEVAKALRIEVIYEEDLRRRLALDWRRELIPELEAQAVAHLRGSVAGLRGGDVLQVEYLPGKGTTIRVNKSVVVSGAHHDLMLAFLDRWLGQQPVSEEMKRALRAGS